MVLADVYIYIVFDLKLIKAWTKQYLTFGSFHFSFAVENMLLGTAAAFWSTTTLEDMQLHDRKAIHLWSS